MKLNINGIQYGDEVTDQVTNFSGIVIGVCGYLTGCAQVLVQPRTKKGGWVDAKWFDYTRLSIDGRDLAVAKIAAGDSLTYSKKGGPGNPSEMPPVR